MRYARNTPTHVGKTDAGSFRGSFFEKHPHARGEDKPEAGAVKR